MKKRTVAIALALTMGMSTMMTACGGAAGSQSNVSREDLIGVWELEKDGVVETVTLLEDGTYLSECVSSMGFTLSSEYKWTYENGVYTVNYESMGVTSVYNKVTLDGDKLTLDNGEGKIVYTKQ